MNLKVAVFTSLLLAVPLAAQEPQAESQADAEAPLDVETILSTPSEESSYGEAPRCISTTRIRGSEVLDGRHIVFRMSQDEYYLVQFENRCPMLERNSTIVYETQGSRLCQLDPIRAVSGLGATAQIGPICMIPGFQPVTKEQVALIRESLKQLRRARPTDVPADTQPRTEPEAPAETAADETAPG